MEDPFSLFESENNPLKDSMRRILEQLPNNSDQVKSVFKSLLLVHVGKIKDPEERSTWKSFINALDNFGKFENQGIYSFGPLNNQETTNDFAKAVKDRKAKGLNYYKKNLKSRVFYGWRVVKDILRERKKALKCVMIISLRLRYVETFWRWQLFSSGLEKISNEFYFKNLCNKALFVWKSYTAKNEKKLTRYKKAKKYWTMRTMLVVLINWTGMLRDSYHMQRNNSNGSQKPRHFAYEKLDLTKQNFPDHKKNDEFRTKKFTESKKFGSKKILEKLKKQAGIGKIFKIKEKFFGLWRLKYVNRLHGKKVLNLYSKNALRNGFKTLRLWAMKGSYLNTEKYKHSIDNLTDYELSVKITVLEKKLSSLHQQLLSEQITYKSLLCEKEEVLKIYY